MRLSTLPVDNKLMEGFDLKRGQKDYQKASDRGKFLWDCIPSMSDPYVGLLTYVRVYSGKINQGDTFITLAKKKRRRYLGWKQTSVRKLLLQAQEI